MSVDRPLFMPGDIVKHFKRETICDPQSNDYLKLKKVPRTEELGTGRL